MTAAACEYSGRIPEGKYERHQRKEDRHRRRGTRRADAGATAAAKRRTVSVYERDENRSARVQGSALDLHERSGLAALDAAGLMEAFWANHRPDLDSLRLTDADGTAVRARVHLVQMSGRGKRPEIERGPLRDLLLDSLQPGTVQWDCRLNVVRFTGRIEVLLRVCERRNRLSLADSAFGWRYGANSHLRATGDPYLDAVLSPSSSLVRGPRPRGKAGDTWKLWDLLQRPSIDRFRPAEWTITHAARNRPDQCAAVRGPDRRPRGQAERLEEAISPDEQVRWLPSDSSTGHE